MNNLENDWTESALQTVTETKHLLTDLSIRTRTAQFEILNKLIEINKDTKCLDVGTTSDESLKDSNLFLRIYPYIDNLTTATVEDAAKLKQLYPRIKVVKIYPKKKTSIS